MWQTSIPSAVHVVHTPVMLQSSAIPIHQLLLNHTDSKHIKSSDTGSLRPATGCIPGSGRCGDDSQLN